MQNNCHVSKKKSEDNKYSENPQLNRSIGAVQTSCKLHICPDPIWNTGKNLAITCLKLEKSLLIWLEQKRPCNSDVLQREVGNLCVLDVLPCKGRWFENNTFKGQRSSGVHQYCHTAVLTVVPENWYCWTIAFAVDQKAAQQTAIYNNICLQERARKANLKIKKEQDEIVAVECHRLTLRNIVNSYIYIYIFIYICTFTNDNPLIDVPGKFGRRRKKQIKSEIITQAEFCVVT